MILNSFHFEECPKNVICFQGEHISEDMIEKCFLLDNDFFNLKYIYDRDKIKRLILSHSELFFIFYDVEKNMVIGYNFLFLLKQESFELYKAGKISYFTMGEIDIADCKKEKTAVLFYLSTAYSKNDKILNLLGLSQNCIVYMIAKLNSMYNLKISDVFYDVVNEFDLRYANSLKLNNIKQTSYELNIYAKTFNPETFFPKAVYTPLLIKLYNKN